MDDMRDTAEGRGAIAWMAGHSVAANLAMVFLLVGGFLALRNIKQEVFPEFTIDAVNVSVAYPGASPDEVEQGVVLAIEEAVQGLDGVDEVTSVSSEGRGTVTVEALTGTDVQQLAQDIESEVNRITTFPDEAEEPQVRAISRQHEVLSLILYADAPETVLHTVAERLREELLQEANITLVEVTGLPDVEISVEVPEENLRRYGLTLQEIATRIRAAATELAGGGIKTASGEILVRMKERRDYGAEFARLPIITTPDGSEVLLGEIATIEDGFEDSDYYAMYDGKRAVMLEVYRVGDQTPLQVAAAVGRTVEAYRPQFPPGFQVAVHRDMSEVYRDRVQLLLRNGSMGLVLVLLLLGVFLEARLAFWVMMGIPISFLGSFLLLPAAGVTINMMSLFAFIIALGIVVDDAIVVGENVYHYRQRGMPFLQAAVRGTREVATPVTFSILTNIAAFMPLCVIPGTTGMIFRTIPLVVVLVFLISLGECLFVLPAHLAHQKRRVRRGPSGWIHARQQAFSTAFRHWTQDRYGPLLAFALRWRYLTVAVAVSVLALVLSYAMSGRMGFGLFPKMESDVAQAQVVLPYGAPVEKTEAAVRRLLAGARQVVDECGHDELVEGTLAVVGNGGSHAGSVQVQLAGPKVRESIMSTDEFAMRWREAVDEIVGADYVKFESDLGGPGHGAGVTVELSHRDIDVLERASRELAAELSTFPMVKDVDDGFQVGKQQFDFTMKPEGMSLGLTAREAANQVRHAFYGAEAVKQQRGRNELTVMVRLPERERRTAYTLDELMIRTPSGGEVPLRQVAEARQGRAYTTINRRSGRRVVEVTADVSPRSRAGEVLAELQTDALPALLGRHRGLAYSFEGRQADMRESMGSLKVTFVLALLTIYAMLAIPFRSYVQPAIVMVSIPFGIVGAFIGHLLMGYDLSVVSMFGIVALSGVVVNDALVLIDFANRRRREDAAGPWDAIHSAGIQRFRPIILTSLTTFGGLAPMIFETSFQARMMVPMAISLGFGILFATAITLVLVPCLYMVAEDARRLLGSREEAAVAVESPSIVADERLARGGLPAAEQDGS